MRMFLGLSLAVVFACYVLFAYITLDRRADDVRITSLIENTVAAINSRDLGAAMRGVSENFRDPENLNKDRLRMLVAQAFRAEPDYKASAVAQDMSLYGDRATLTVRAKVVSGSGEPIYNRSLVISLQKEKGRHAVILPAKVWRIVGAGNLGIGSQF